MLKLISVAAFLGCLTSVTSRIQCYGDECIDVGNRCYDIRYILGEAPSLIGCKKGLVCRNGICSLPPKNTEEMVG
ncbi:hypothetical protein C0J52_18732 [Blattella germanica]|nr:hypothetical protein C0J52_18732 [Blattella germanica]